MSSDIVVLLMPADLAEASRQTFGNNVFAADISDRFWAINTVANTDATHDQWYGRRDTKLSHSKLANMDWHERMQQKLDEGYRRVDKVTIDTETCTVIPLLQETEDDLEIPTSLWYRVSNVISLSHIRDYLNITIHLLSEHCADEVDKLKQLPTFNALYEGKLNGGAEYREGPLAVFLLFGLRRFLNDVAGSDASSDLVQIADDSNNMLPDRFHFIGGYIEKSCVALCNKNGWLDGTDDLHDDEGNLLLELTEKHNLLHYTSVSVKNPLAIAMGCIDAPIDLAVIRTEKKAAFF